MARACEICGKGTSVGNWRKLLRGNYNITGKRKIKPNLQKIRHQGRRVSACVACIKSATRKRTIVTATAK